MGNPIVSAITAILSRANSWSAQNVFNNSLIAQGSQFYCSAPTTFASTVDVLGATPTWGLKQMFTSALSSITAGGSLTLAHGLAATPVLSIGEIVCQTAELGYSVGDIVQLNGAYFIPSSGPSSYGAFISPDTTNVNVRFGAASVVFTIPNKSTGTLTNITPANWKYRVRAWA